LGQKKRRENLKKRWKKGHERITEGTFKLAEARAQGVPPCRKKAPKVERDPDPNFSHKKENRFLPKTACLRGGRKERRV